MKKSIPVLLLLLLFQIQAYSQFNMRHLSVKPQNPDTADISYYADKKNGWRAAGIITGINLGVWAFDRYIQKADFAYISINTIKDNLNNGFVWDNDQMGTNMFLHPYHGNLYFNSARSNGYNYWESGAFAFGGSLMWELFLENENPSTNDIIATPIGGTIIGEVFYRASDMILDDRKTGSNRFGRELAAFLITPTKGLSRIITGDAWKRRSTTGRQFGIPDISIEVSAGIRTIELRDEVFDKGVGAVTELTVEYGDRFETSDGSKPFDYFNFRLNLNMQASQPVLGQMNIIGRLWATDVVDSKKDYLNFGVYQHFDYYDSDTISSVTNKIPYKFGTPASIGVGLMHKSKRYANWNFDSFAHLNAVILGATLSDHYLVDKRNYNLGSGLSWQLGANLSYKDIVGLSFWYEGYRMFTWKGYPDGYNLEMALEDELDAQGDKSRTSFNTSSLKLDAKLYKNLYLSAIGSFFRRSTRYDYAGYGNVRSTTGEGRLMLTYKF